MIILIHSSKTMRPADGATKLRQPIFIDQATELARYLTTLTELEISQVMRVSSKLAQATYVLMNEWAIMKQRPAIDSFLGDIYSGLQVNGWTQADRTYADQHLRILSGLYGVLRPLDGIRPYRLEMGYRLPADPYRNLAAYWSDIVAKSIGVNEVVVNLAAAEYSKVFGTERVAHFVTPRFLTISPKTGQPTFVVVHAKIARGAFAGWLIRNRIDAIDKLPRFDEIGYRFEPTLSAPLEPVFICKEFGGLGLSVRLS